MASETIVVMYSGNHSVVHALDTVLDAALRLREDPRFLFLFIGGGVRKQDVTRFKGDHGLDNIRQLPYQDRDNLHFSLGAGDLHLVIMGEGFTGYTHPNKVYGAMFIGRPILYIGPRPSHIKLDELRVPLLRSLKANFRAPNQVSLYLFRDGSWVVENFSDQPAAVTLNAESLTVDARGWRYRWRGAD